MSVTEINGIDVVNRDDLVDSDILVSAELDKWADGSWFNRDTVGDAIDYVGAANSWDGVGVLLSADGVPVTVDVDTDDYGSVRFAGIHMCEMSQWVANWQYIETELNGIAKGDDVDQYVTRNNVLFYNLGNPKVVEFIRTVERSLSVYPILSDDKHNNVESDMADEIWSDMISSVEFTNHDIETNMRIAWGENGSCPECGTDNVEETAESEGYGYCDECDVVSSDMYPHTCED